jgi:uncharacterized protein (DUF934 family)
MSALIKLGSNGWQASTAHAVLAWKTVDEWQPGQPLWLAGDAELEPRYVQASAIAIEFPAFTDGRGLSLAVLIRSRLGYEGELRAVGATHEDIVHYLVRCGFDAIELPLDRNVTTALDLISPYSVHYQASVHQPEPAFTRVQRGV